MIKSDNADHKCELTPSILHVLLKLIVYSLNPTLLVSLYFLKSIAVPHMKETTTPRYTTSLVFSNVVILTKGYTAVTECRL